MEAEGATATLALERDPMRPTSVGKILKYRYRLAEVLGEGGMSVVYLARDLSLPGKTWAVKEVYPDPQSGEDARMAREAFEAEARALGSLSHPGVPAIVDTFFEDGCGYLVMARVPGRDLQSILDEGGRWREDEALHLGLEICRILRYLHERDTPLIFRDLKPSNVMICSGVESDRVMLIDFGISRHFRSTRRTDTVAMGTLGYAAPEQYSADRPAEPRADVYSLGALLYFILTGRDPQLHAPFDFPPLREFIPDLGAETVAAVEHALSYDDARRPASAADMERLLQKALDAAKARRDPVLVRRRSTARRATAAAALLMLLGVGLWTAFLGSRADGVLPALLGRSVDVATFPVAMNWRAMHAASTLPPPMGRPLLLFGKRSAWVVMTHPGNAAGVGAVGDTLRLDTALDKILAAPPIEYWGWPSCVLDHADRLVVADIRGVMRVENGSYRLLWRPEGFQSDSALTLAPSSPVHLIRGGNGRAYAAWPGGFARLTDHGLSDFAHLERDGAALRVVRAPYRADAPETWGPRDPHRFWIDARGAAWVDEGGLARVDRNGTTVRFAAARLGDDGAPLLFAADGAGRTWLAPCNAGEMYRFDGNMMHPIALKSSVFGLLDTPQPAVLAITGSGLYRLEAGGARALRVPWATATTAEYVGSTDAGGRHWFWGPGGLYRLDRGAWAQGVFHGKHAAEDR